MTMELCPLARPFVARVNETAPSNRGGTARLSDTTLAPEKRAL